MVAGPAAGHPFWQEEQQRLQVGLELFPAILGALEALGAKVSADGTLVVAVVHKGARDTARHVATQLEAMPPVHGHPLRIVTLDASDLDAYQGPPLAGVFVASIGVGERRLQGWPERLQALVFSPFPGDVEAGAVAGIHVSDQILPFLNLAQAARAGLRFRPFLLRVARRHE